MPTSLAAATIPGTVKTESELIAALESYFGADAQLSWRVTDGYHTTYELTTGAVKGWRGFDRDQNRSPRACAYRVKAWMMSSKGSWSTMRIGTKVDSGRDIVAFSIIT
jgi:hypothetical protein